MIQRESETKDGGRKRWRRQWERSEKHRRWHKAYEIQRGATTHRPKAPVWPEEEGSQESGGQSTDEGVWRKNCTESLKKMVAKR